MKRMQTLSAKHTGPRGWNHLRVILVPTDFSQRTAGALRHAVDLARQYDAEIHLLHVVTPLEGDAYSPLRYTPEANVLREKPAKLIYDLLSSAAAQHQAEDVRIELIKQRGANVAATILRYARKENADLIVIGTHGITGVKHFFLGSIAQEVVHSAPCNVLIVHERDGTGTKLADLRRILVPVDFSAASAGLLRQARRLATDYGAEIDLLHVVESPSFLAPFTGIATLSDLVPNLHDQAQRHLERLLEEAGGPDVPVRVHVEEGRPASGILDFAEQHDTDLIVIATRGLSGMKHFFLGSVTERVVRAASCLVLSVATPESASVSDAAPAVLASDRPV